MTAPARINQADVDRVMKGVKSAEFERVKIVFDFANCRVEVIVGEDDSPETTGNPWDTLLNNEPSNR